MRTCESDIHHELSKTRMTADGKPIEDATKGKELAGDAERIARQKATGYCQCILRILRCHSRLRLLESTWPLNLA